MIVADVMSREVVAVRPETSLAEASAAMMRHLVSGLPVLDETGRLVGILSEGDLLRRPELGTCTRQGAWLKGFNRTEALAAEYIHTHSRRVGDVMTPNPTFVRPEMTLTKAIELMLAKRVKRLPVLSGECLVGIISRFDLLTALSARLTEETQEVSDDVITTALAEALAREPWAPRSGVTLSVADGVVTLRGHVFSSPEARALCVLAENTAGVRAINDELDVDDDAPRVAANND